MSISSEDSFASCTSYPYSEDLMKSDGSRSVTPSVASDRLSRDDLDQYCMQTESSRSMNSLIDNLQEGQMTTSSTQESLVVSAGLVSCSCETCNEIADSVRRTLLLLFFWLPANTIFFE